MEAKCCWVITSCECHRGRNVAVETSPSRVISLFTFHILYDPGFESKSCGQIWLVIMSPCFILTMDVISSIPQCRISMIHRLHRSLRAPGSRIRYLDSFLRVSRPASIYIFCSVEASENSSTPSLSDYEILL